MNYFEQYEEAKANPLFTTTQQLSDVGYSDIRFRIDNTPFLYSEIVKKLGFHIVTDYGLYNTVYYKYWEKFSVASINRFKHLLYPETLDIFNKYKQWKAGFIISNHMFDYVEHWKMVNRKRVVSNAREGFAKRAIFNLICDNNYANSIYYCKHSAIDVDLEEKEQERAFIHLCNYHSLPLDY